METVAKTPSTVEAPEAPVLLLAETGFIIRNLLLGEFAAAVAAQCPLVVCVPDPNDSNLNQIVGDAGIQLVDFPREPYPTIRFRGERYFLWETWMYRFKQAEKSTDSLELQTKLWEGDRSVIGSTLDNSIVNLGRFLNRLGMLGLPEDLYLRRIWKRPITRRWVELLQKLRPAAIVSTMLTHCTLYRCSSDLPALLAARSLRIPTGTLVQSWDNLSSKTSILPGWVDRYWTWSERMTQELVQLNPRVSDDHVRVVGSPQFDFHCCPDVVESRENYFSRIGMDPNRHLIVIGTGTAIQLPNEPHAMVQLAQALVEQLPECQVLIRLHPKDDGVRWQEFRQQLRNIGAYFQTTAPQLHMDLGGFIPPRDFYREQISCLSHASVVVNTSSSLTVDAAILDRPVICIAYDIVPDQVARFSGGRASAYCRSSHYAPLVETGGVTLVRSEEQCLSAIRDSLKNPNRHRRQRRRLADLVAGERRGGAGARLAGEVLELAGAMASAKARVLDGNGTDATHN